ncbi:Bacteriophage Lambda NinG protein, partial [Haemophilus influenzae]
MQTKHTLD